MRLDSGVDVSLNNQFSSLSLHTNIGYNDLNCDVKSGGVKTESSASLHNKIDETERQVEPWELYFQQDEDGDT